MKKAFFFIVGIVIVNNFITADDFRLPPKIDLTRYISGNIKVNFPNIFSWGTRSDVRIWGWSRTGKIAISQEYIQPGYDNVKPHISRLEYYIIDLNKDEIVFECSWDSYNGMSYSDKPPQIFFDMSESGVKKLFDLQKVSISNANARHGIIYNQSVFLSFPVKNDNYTYSCRANFTTRMEDEGAGQTIDNYDVIVSRNDGKRKAIASVSLYDGDHNFFPNVNICGYFKSPYENRIVVVIAEELSGLGEGIIWKFNGCHLEAGFN